ncbi:pyridoxal phosphate-dependent transferase [Roridomyces roridus]|uniref:Pyridoxal phosphate-dependent transferase n=1 Tax=Roridomyces roridus TaxID=1738132 RepID=A0AAD7BVN8_9AGAR|nr:pyridoxal phosphate-dependent transferase [Roridomyces roridus]
MFPTPQSSPPAGCAIPPGTPHSLLNSLPEWAQVVSIAAGTADFPRETSYPRFFPSPVIQQLNEIILKALASRENCFLFPTRLLAEEFRDLILLDFPTSSCVVQSVTHIVNAPPPHLVFAVLYSAEMPKVLNYYTFYGAGISTRLAERCVQRCQPSDPGPNPLGLPSPGHWYSDYYERNPPLDSPSIAKDVLRSRFSDGNIRGVQAFPEDVYLTSSGMEAIYRTYKLLWTTVGSRIPPASLKVAHINLIYACSYRFLDRPSSPGYHFFADDDLDALEALLNTGTPENPAIMALYTDFPGNPHLRSPDMVKLRALADRFNFPIIVDETVAGHLTCDLLPYCDVVVCSLTKIFSGLANVLGGALMLNPASRYYKEFKAYMDANYEDSLFDSDALVLEMNSRELVDRTRIVNHNAEQLADALYARSVAGDFKGGVIQAVHFPKFRTKENFERCRNLKTGITGYGSMLSVTFTSLEAAKTFYAALQCYKAPTLGTVFTLAIAFSVLANPPDKMEWIEAHGVEQSLVRFSVGMEETSSILKCVLEALLVAEERHSVKSQ